MAMPFCPLPEMTLPRQRGHAMVFWNAALMTTPYAPFAMALMPLPLVPIRLLTTLSSPVAPPEIATPFWVLPEMTFPGRGRRRR